MVILCILILCFQDKYEVPKEIFKSGSVPQFLEDQVDFLYLHLILET